MTELTGLASYLPMILTILITAIMLGVLLILDSAAAEMQDGSGSEQTKLTEWSGEGTTLLDCIREKNDNGN